MSEVQTRGRAWEVPGKGVVVQTTRPPIENLSDDVVVLWHDKRAISPEQRRKAWALMTEIATFQGQSKEETYAEQKTRFTLKHLELLQNGLFGLSTADMSMARAFITMLVDIIVENGIITKEPVINNCEDINRYLYVSLINRKCAVCGQHADIHHCEGSRIGMGGNREKVSHVGRELMPLCRRHHNECHDIGQDEFNRRYHLPGGIIATEDICDKLGLNKKGKKHEQTDDHR